jgi:hypothetical protein
MINNLYGLVTLPIRMLLFRNFIKKEVAAGLRREHPDLTEPQSFYLAEKEIRADHVAALDPLGGFGETFQRAKTDPVGAVVESAIILGGGILFIAVGMVVIVVVIFLVLWMLLALLAHGAS